MNAIFVGGKLNGRTMTDMQIFNTVWNGRVRPNYSIPRAFGAVVPRAELDGAPLVDGYLPPMWDGDKLRYETQDVYNMMSN